MTAVRPKADRAALLSALYEAFNRRDAETILSNLHPDVTWPNGWEGGVVQGRDGVRDYWTRQWAAIDPKLTPETFKTGPDGQVVVRVRQVVRTLAGQLASDRRLQHVYRFRDGLIVAMEPREIP